MDAIGEVRRFNRFYTRLVGLLDEHLPDSDLSLPEARFVYELASAGEATAAEIGRAATMDKAHMSRIVQRLANRGLLIIRKSPHHGKHRLLALSPSGAAAFDRLNAGTDAQIGTLIAPLGSEDSCALVSAMTSIQAMLGSGAASAPVTLRAPANGDLAWIAHRQALLYAREYGWNAEYEALVLHILGDYARAFDPACDKGWIAERGGRIGGSIFLIRGDAPGEAKLRLLYVEPWMRGTGTGRLLVDTCIDRARALDYRRLVLWTNSVLVAARRIYETAGFTLVEENPHHSFGHDLTGQTWALDL